MCRRTEVHVVRSYTVIFFTCAQCGGGGGGEYLHHLRIRYSLSGVPVLKLNFKDGNS